MPNLFLGTWAVIVLVFLFLTTRQPPSTPLKPITDGGEYQMELPLESGWPRVATSSKARYETLALDTDHPARWAKTPCGRVTHIRSRADVN